MLSRVRLPTGLKDSALNRIRLRSQSALSRVRIGAIVQLGKALFVCVTILGPSICGGCAVPFFDVPNDTAGQPTVQTIVERIQCEIRNMVRDDMGDDDVTSFHRRFLLNGDYDVAIALSLEVNDTGVYCPRCPILHPFPP